MHSPNLLSQILYSVRPHGKILSWLWYLYLSFSVTCTRPSNDPTQMLSSIFYFKFSVFIAVVHPLLLAAFSFFKKPQRWLSSILFCFRISFSRSSNSNFLLNFHPKQLSQGGGEVSRYHHSGLTGQARQG